MRDANLAVMTITNGNLTDVAINQATLAGMRIDGLLVTDLLRAFRAAAPG